MDTITLRLIVEGEDTVEIDRAVYEAAKAAGQVDQLLDAYISDVETETTVVEPDSTCVLLADHGLVLPPPAPVYLIWSAIQGAWWGSGGKRYVHDVWAAGRYDEAEARKACEMRTWANGAQPPEVMVLAPESGRGPFAAGELAGMSKLMNARIMAATKARIADRAAARVGA